MAAPFPLTQVFDTALRPDETPATGWATGPTFGDTGTTLRIVSNSLKGGSAGSVFNSSMGPLSCGLPCEFGMDLNPLPASGDTVWIEWLSGLLATPDGCGASYTHGVGARQVQFFKFIAGVGTQLSSSPTVSQPAAAGDAIGGRVWIDGAWELWYRWAALNGGAWTMLASGTGMTTATQGTVAIEAFNNTAGFRNVFGGQVGSFLPHRMPQGV